MKINKKMLKWTILMIAMVQMPTLAVGPALSAMKAVFVQVDITTLQTALQVPNLVSPFVALTVMIITGRSRKKAPQKTIIVFGLGMLLVSAVGMLVLHREFWTLYLWGACIGIALGSFIPSTNSLLYDCFDDKERRDITGLQTTFINGGGILMSVIGGLLAGIGWFGGYLAFFLVIPVIFMCIRYIPGWDTPALEKAAGGRDGRMHLDPNIIYYALIIFVFMAVYNVAGTNMALLVVDELEVGNAAVTGIISAVQLAGGTVAGLFFGKISRKLRDYIIALGFAVIAVTFAILGNASSLPVIIATAFFTGSAMSMVMPQCSYGISLYADERSSTVASAFAWSFAPSLGGFVSAKIFTSSSLAIAGKIGEGTFQWGFFCFKGTDKIARLIQNTGDAVCFRYGYVAFVALLLASVLCIATKLRKNSRINFT